MNPTDTLTNGLKDFDYRKFLLIIFSCLLIYSAGAVSLFEVANAMAKVEKETELKFWDHWSFALIVYAGLELMRGCFVMSNVFIRSIDPEWAKIFTWAAIGITLGISVKIYFQTGADISNPKFWTLQVYNALILLSEMSISVNVAGSPIDWNGYLRYLKGIEESFNFSGLPDWAFPPLSHIDKYVIEIKGDLKKNEAEVESLGESRSMLKGITGKETPTASDVAAISRYSRIGKIASDSWIYVGDSEGYVILCAGKEGYPDCKPFKSTRSKVEVRCPSCGKLHSRTDFRQRIIEATQETIGL